MAVLAQTQLSPTLQLEDFVPDAPKKRVGVSAPEVSQQGLIDGVKIELLTSGSDHRGMLHELLTMRDAEIEPIVHVYEVVAEPESVRAWVYHKHQFDRLCFTNGHFRWALYDIRPGSRTYGKLNILDVGEHLRCCLTIPPYVIHGAKNCGDWVATFVNFPTNIYNHDQPDKYRLPHGHPGIPYVFD